MSDSLSIVDPLAQPGWDDLLLASGDHDFFHTACWARVLKESYGYRPAYFAAARGGRLTLLVPLMEVNSFLTGRRGVSLPFSDFCDPFVSQGSPPLDEVLAAVIGHGREAGWRYVELRGGRYRPEAPASDTYFVHDLDLTAGEEALFRRLRDSTKRNIRKAETNPLEMRRETSLDAVRAFYRLHCLTRRGHGLPPQPFSFFRRIAGHVLGAGRGFVNFALHDGKPIAGAVFFHFGGEALFKFGASDNRHQRLRAGNLVIWDTIRWLSGSGYRGLSLGRTEVGNRGLLQFKRGWGAAEKELRYLRYDLRKGRFVERSPGKNAACAGLLRRMPMPFLRLAGIVSYRHMG